MGKKEEQSIFAFFNRNTVEARVTQTYSSTEFKEIKEALEFIHKESNSIKHNKDYRMETALQMIPVIEKLEKVTADMLNYYTSNKKN